MQCFYLKISSVFSGLPWNSDELLELSYTYIDDYAEKVCIYLKSGRPVARIGIDRFGCLFCPVKKKQDYRYISACHWGGCIQPHCKGEAKIFSRLIRLMRQAHYRRNKPMH
jgi:hypothetical protein